MQNSVFANGIWKSGNNLLMKLCGLLGVEVSNFGIATSTLIGENYAARRIIRGPRWQKSPINVGLDMPVNISRKWLQRKLRKYQGTCIGGHSSYSKQLEDMLVGNNYRIIHIVRDPRDVIVSFAHWIEKRPDYYAYPAFKDMSIDERITHLIKGFSYRDMYFDSFATVLDRSYGWMTSRDNVLLVRFEDLVGVKGGGSMEKQYSVVDEIARWINVEKFSREYVCNNLFGETPTFRRGKIGGWSDELSSETVELFDKSIGDRVESWGYDR